MAAIEQLVFGLAPNREKGREVLGSSPGVSRDCAEEVVRLCEGWGAIPAEGLRRAVVLAFPLTTRLSSLPGELHVAIRIAPGLKPIYHALIISRMDFLEFDLNPFTLVQENLFLESWTASDALVRREVQPGSLAPLVSPPPGAADVGFVDEAVRQMLANHRLQLPLERAGSDSDRFLALVVAALPRVLRQELRFASWSPNGTNTYTLAATSKENAHYTSWHPFLMTSVFGELTEACEEYLEQLKIQLRAGDLTGIERHSRNTRLEVTRQTSGLAKKKSMSVAATVKQRLEPRTKKPVSAAPSRPQSDMSTGAPPARKHANNSAPPRPRSRPRPRRRGGGNGVRHRFAAVLSLAILAAGAYYLWTSGQWTRLPGVASGNVRLQTDTSHGVVDIGTIYQGALKGVQSGGAGGSAAVDGVDRRQGLEMLHQAGQLLEKQGQDFLEEVDQTLSGDELDGVAPAPPARLYERGQVLARELRRLALARVSLRGQIDWHDLADLEGRELEARFDSLLANRHGRQSLEPALVDVDHLLRSVDIRSRQVGGLARLQELLNRDHWDERWCRRCDAAIDDLGGVRQPQARQLRDDAHVLVRLKRAEHSTALAQRAYQDDYAATNQVSPAVADILPRVHERAGASESGPALLAATSNFYLNLQRAVDAGATVPQRSASIRNLDQNRALTFDAAVYGEHLSRVRFLVLEQSLRSGADLDSLPEICFDGGNRQEYLDFLQARDDGLDGAGWRLLAGELREPFLIRWAQHRAGMLDTAAAQRSGNFATGLADLRTRRTALVQLAAAGGDCTDAWRDLTAATVAMRDQHQGAFADSAANGLAYARVAALATTLERPPPLMLTGVTVRLGQELSTEPRDVVVELQAGAETPFTSGWVRLGPAAPAGSGWVGSGEVAWALDLVGGANLSVRVRDAVSGDVLGQIAAGAWLVDRGPRGLGNLDIGNGVRVAWKLAGPYWRDLMLPELDGSPSL